MDLVDYDPRLRHSDKRNTNHAASQYVHGLKIAPRFLLKQAHTTKYRPLLHPRIGESLPLRPESNLEAEIIVLTVLRFA